MPTARPASARPALVVGRQVKRVIDSQWVEVETEKGEQYFANMINGDSRWDLGGDDADEENLERRTKGTGIGISVGQEHTGTALVVEEVVKGSSAFRSQRVHVRDELLAIDGASLARSSPAQEPPPPLPSHRPSPGRPDPLVGPSCGPLTRACPLAQARERVLQADGATIALTLRKSRPG